MDHVYLVLFAHVTCSLIETMAIGMASAKTIMTVNFHPQVSMIPPSLAMTIKDLTPGDDNKQLKRLQYPVFIYQNFL